MSIFKRIAPCIVLGSLVCIPVFLAFLGQASAGPNAQATVTIDLIANGGVGNQTDDGIRSGVVAGQGTKIAVEVFAKGVTTSLAAMNVEFDFKAEELRLDKVENSAFQFAIPEPTGVNFAATAPVTLPQSGFIGRAEFSTVLDVTGREFHLGIKKVLLIEESLSSSDAIVPEAMAMLSTISFNKTVSNPGDFDAPTAVDEDFDGNGRVGDEDFSLFAAVFGTIQGDGKYEAKYDLDGDGQVGASDFLIFANGFGGPPTQPPPRPPLPPVGVPFQDDCAECPWMVRVPTGSFLMGSPPGESGRYDDEGPQHRVSIDYPLAVGVYEVTFAEWEACVDDGGCNGYRADDNGWGRGNRPVINVGWTDAQSYVRWLSQKTGHNYGLLSESEWEYVARAGTTTPFHFGSTISTDQANYNGNYTYGSGRQGVYRGQTVAVGSFSANAWGVHDMHGNVWEWVQDCWNGSYVGAPSDGSAWTSGDCNRRVLRGGSWFNLPWSLRSALRYWYSAENRINNVGFRVVRRF